MINRRNYIIKRIGIIISVTICLVFLLCPLQSHAETKYQENIVGITVQTNEPMLLYIENADNTPYKLYYTNKSEEIRFSIDEPDTYTYYISQVIDERDAVTVYDRQKFRLDISAIDVGKDTLEYIVSITNTATNQKLDAISFQNGQTEMSTPQTPKQEPHYPKKGETTWTVTVYDTLYDVRYRLVRWFTDLFAIDDPDTPLALPGMKKWKKPETGDTIDTIFLSIVSISSFAIATGCYMNYRKRKSYAKV